VGHTSPEVWKNIVAGKSGVSRITRFDPSNFACQIAAEVKDFDPLNFVEKKEVKKMGRFIHLALAAADEAMTFTCLRRATPGRSLDLARAFSKTRSSSHRHGASHRAAPASSVSVPR